MANLNRRSALALSTAAGVTPFFAFTKSTAAATYSPSQGKELAPGVRAIETGNRPSMISAYKTVSMLDVVFQPGSKLPVGDPMESDMVCHVSEGELKVQQGDKEFVAKSGDVWSCGKGSTKEGAINSGASVSVMRIIFLKA